MKEKTKKAWGKVGTAASIVLLILAVFLLATVIIAKIRNQTPKIFGFSFHVVVTGSMDPEIKVGDLVIGKSADIASIKLGEDVLFISTNPGSEGLTVVHRVIAINDNGGITELTTKGTANADQDSNPVTQIIGKSVAVSTFWGKIFSFFLNPLGAVFFVIIIISLMALYWGIKSFVKTYKKIKAPQPDPESGLSAEEDKELRDKLRKELLDELEREKDSPAASQAPDQSVGKDEKSSKNINKKQK